MFNIAIVVGSLRKDSINRKLARALIQLQHPELKFTLTEIADIPLYNQDLDNDLPPSVVRFKKEMVNADAVLLVTPEYNRSIPGVLKNIIDWGTRPYGQNIWTGKLIASVGTSPGAVGTAVAQSHLYSIMVAQGSIMIGQPPVYLVYKDGLIDDEFVITVEDTRAFLRGFLDSFALAISKYHHA